MKTDLCFQLGAHRLLPQNIKRNCLFKSFIYPIWLVKDILVPFANVCVLFCLYSTYAQISSLKCFLPIYTLLLIIIIYIYNKYNQHFSWTLSTPLTLSIESSDNLNKQAYNYSAYTFAFLYYIRRQQFVKVVFMSLTLLLF